MLCSNYSCVLYELKSAVTHVVDETLVQKQYHIQNT